MQIKAYEEDLSCELYVNAPVGSIGLAQEIANVLGERVTEIGYIESELYDILFNRNLSYDEKKMNQMQDGFLYYPHYLNVEAHLGQQPGTQIALVGSIMEFIWSRSWRVVAVCNYEDKLPREGGYLN